MKSRLLTPAIAYGLGLLLAFGLRPALIGKNPAVVLAVPLGALLYSLLVVYVAKDRPFGSTFGVLYSIVIAISIFIADFLIDPREEHAWIMAAAIGYAIPALGLILVVMSLAFGIWLGNRLPGKRKRAS